jgi:hypothetical protein
MPEADQTHTPSRRGFLGQIAGAALAVAAPDGMSGTRCSDAELLRLGRLLDTAAAKEVEAWRVALNVLTKDANDAAERLNDSAFAIVSNIQSARAQTFEGLRVKARALAWCHGGEIDFDVLGIAGGSTDQNLLVGMVSDLARMLTAA